MNPVAQESAAAEVRAYVVEQFMFGEPGKLSNDDSLLDRGILDSMGVLELVAFVEQRFEVKVDDHELVPENLDSISRIAAFVQRKRG
jgi:acyl carrier protein